MTEMRDDLLERVVDELRTLPPVDEAAVRRIVSAARTAERVGERPARRMTIVLGWWRSPVPLAAAAGIALAAGLAGFVAGDATRRAAAPSAAAMSDPAPESLRLVSGNAAAGAMPAVVPTQFVLDAPRASRVSLVGDFNGWDEAATPLTRDSSSGIWTATVPLTPGRHVYVFVVDGKSLTLDPRAPTAQDPEFGTPSSVVLVGAP